MQRCKMCLNLTTVEGDYDVKLARGEVESKGGQTDQKWCRDTLFCQTGKCFLKRAGNSLRGFLVEIIHRLELPG